VSAAITMRQTALRLAAVREPGLRERCEASGLPRIDGLRRGNERPRAPRLHLDERIAARVPANEVDLAVAGADVAGDDSQATPRELALR